MGRGFGTTGLCTTCFGVNQLTSSNQYKLTAQQKLGAHPRRSYTCSFSKRKVKCLESSNHRILQGSGGVALKNIRMAAGWFSQILPLPLILGGRPSLSIDVFLSYCQFHHCEGLDYTLYKNWKELVCNRGIATTAATGSAPVSWNTVHTK